MKRKAIISASIIFAILLLDQILKIWIKTHMVMGEEIQIIGRGILIHFTEEYVVLVSKKSGLPIDMVQSLFEIMELYQTTPAVSDHGLIDLNRRMELFYKQCF